MGNTQGSHVEKMGGVPGIGPVTAGVTDGGSMSPTHRQDGNVFDFSASTKKKTVVGQDSIEDDRLVMHAAGAGTAPTSAAGSPIPGGAYGVFFCPRRNLNSVEDYSSSSVGVVCRGVSCVVCRVSNLKDGIFSKRFELEG